METIHYHIFDPTGNVTVLVETPAPVEKQPAVGAALLRAERAAEQAGFLSEENGCEIALRMAGGEFCGNATMSAAAFYAARNALRDGCVRVKVSGVDAPVNVRIAALGDGWRAAVEMPRPLSVARADLRGGGSPVVVRYPGIAHVVLPRPMGREDAEKAARDWCAALGGEALGLMLLDREKGALTPLVYVPAPETLYWEHSCASGSAAVGVFLAAEAGEKITAALNEPGGVLEVSAAPDGAVSLTGAVKYVREGTIRL